MDVTGRRASPRQDIEILRILSAAGIVWFHAGRDPWLVGYAGLVAFLALSTWLSFEPTSSRTVLAAAGRRAVRLLIPWGVWMVAFGIRNHFTDRYLIETDRGWWNGFLAGTNIHLWYLPYAFFLHTGLDALDRKLPRAALGWAGGVLALASLATAAHWRPWAATHGFPTIQYCHGLAAVGAGLFFARWREVGRFESFALGGGILAISLVATNRGIEGIGTTYPLGLTAVGVLVFHRARLPAWLDVRRVSACTFGIYLVHPLFRGLFQSIADVPVRAEVWLTAACSLASVAAWRRFVPWLARWTV